MAVPSQPQTPTADRRPVRLGVDVGRPSRSSPSRGRRGGSSTGSPQPTPSNSWPSRLRVSPRPGRRHRRRSPPALPLPLLGHRRGGRVRGLGGRLPGPADEEGRAAGERHLLVSLGTGTSALLVDGDRVTRVGGTALAAARCWVWAARSSAWPISTAWSRSRQRGIAGASICWSRTSTARARFRFPATSRPPPLAARWPRARRAARAARSCARGGRSDRRERGADLLRARALGGAKRIVFGGSTLRDNPALRRAAARSLLRARPRADLPARAASSQAPRRARDRSAPLTASFAG